MIEKPYDGRAKINFDGIKLSIKIPSVKNWFVIVFLTAWMGGWFMGESSATNEMLSADNAGIDFFMAFWLIGWTVGGLFALVVLLWSLFGQETVIIESGVFIVSRGVLNIGIFKKGYDLNSIKNLELNPESTGLDSFFGQKKKTGDFFGFTGGKLRFDYGLKTIRFGTGIDEAEARQLIEEIKRHGFYKDKN
jgi:hypothetical protein